MNRNLTATQNDYAYFLPATSGFYSTFIGKQRYSNYVDPARIPASFGPMGVEAMNYLDPSAAFYYDHCLYSAGHANLDLTKMDESEDMFRNRDRKTSWVLGDSGGFQIGKGVWPADWKNPNCPKAQKKREQVLTWMDTLMDYGMVLDIPAWVARSPAGRAATGINSYIEAVQGTYINNDWFINNRNGNCKFLNVLQGENHADADDWYDRMKKYCDTKIYGDRAFNGWSMGGQNMCDIHLVLKRLVALRFDGLLEKGQHDWMHFLGTSKLEWATLLTDIQRAVRKHHNENFTISFDCASPFLATANGQIYTNTETEDRTKWVYRMQASADDKKYAQDTRLFKDAVIQDGIFSKFESSPLIDQVMMKEICIYGAGIVNPNLPANTEPDPYNPLHWTVMPDQNKIGKVGRTSWDSFTYAIMMGHNVWMHVNAVQEANRRYDAGNIPAMLVQEKFDRLYFKDVVEAIFATSNRGEAEAIVEDYSRFWMSIIGTRGASGKKTVNASTHFANLFDEVDDDPVQLEHSEEFTDDEIHKLDDLEDSVK
ncbi:hypothetical protein UFOVP181_283 [uncultured Caudovirales phage]|uniref:Uncharacterized protein n=1 Tax=uncultured Caudovirales phage TaxID=2100421 RepID=A0A6J5KXJ5_9CAUD|nr:hypothetical protein UFOVP57_356 [uncultured Caudovirales phage]CAB5209006.1 hypothetical protein UFOVP181_283 [uncultured Caudovirales phage]